MRKKVTNIEQVTDNLRPYLEQYLQDNGINTNTNFPCINPKHEDTNASMSIKGDSGHNVANCFGQCGCSADIFTAAYFLEGKPIKGPGFIEENVKYLAEKYGVKMDFEDPTPEEIYEYRTYDAYKFASKLISDRNFGDYSLVDKEIERRGWDKEKCAEWGIGTVDYNDYKNRMKAAGYEVSFLNGVDLASSLFNNHNLLFTVYDDFGRPVGFSAKNLKYDKKDPQSKKYINTRGTGLECAIFKKGERLYGFDIAKKANSPLYIFEGQADVITGRHFGIMNCCCTMGTAFTDHHINLLKRHGLFNIVLVFDSDKAGEEAAIKALDNRFSANKEFRVKIIQLPAELDPDELLRTKGIDEFVRQKKWSAFEWRMMKFIDEAGEELDDEKKVEITEQMSKIIVAEKSYPRQEYMAKQVAKMTGSDVSTIMAEVKRLRNEKEGQVQEKKIAAVQSLLNNIHKNPDDLDLALAECQTIVSDINKEAVDKSNSKSNIDFVLSQKEDDEKKPPGFAGLKMDPEGLGNIAARLDESWDSGRLFYIGGGEQSAKTSLLSQMAYEIVTNNENIICVYHSIDDAAKLILYKWVCRAHNELKLQLNHVASPNYWGSQEGLGWIKQERDIAYQRIIKLMEQQKLILADASDGVSFMYPLSLVRQLREKYPSKKILLFCDNFHKYPDFADLGEAGKTKKLSNVMKTTVVAENITIISSVEYKKMEPGQRPSNYFISQSKSLQYDADVIMHCYNDVYMNGAENAVLRHEYNNEIYPRIWVKFGKNKVSGYIDREFLDLHPFHATLRSVDKDIALQEQRERVAFLKENESKSW